MVFYFDSNGYLLFMGRDKFENEDLIKYGWPEDLWFHVDKLSSAHVYIRLPIGKTIDEVPPEVVHDCAVLVKANSIEGCKLSEVAVVYTPWSNLKKTSDMAVGQVGFHSNKAVRRLVAKKENAIVNRLNKTKRQVDRVDFAAELAERNAKVAKQEKREAAERAMREKAEAEERARQRELRSYDRLYERADEFDTSNQYGDDVNYQDIEDDFM